MFTTYASKKFSDLISARKFEQEKSDTGANARVVTFGEGDTKTFKVYWSVGFVEIPVLVAQSG
jgi:hypothetical protein